MGSETNMRVSECRDLLSARWCEPSLSVVDVRVGDDTAANDVDDDEG